MVHYLYYVCHQYISHIIYVYNIYIYITYIYIFIYIYLYIYIYMPQSHCCDNRWGTLFS